MLIGNLIALNPYGIITEKSSLADTKMPDYDSSLAVIIAIRQYAFTNIDASEKIKIIIDPSMVP